MPTDWPAILPTLKADEASGLGIREIARKYNLPSGSVARWLRKPTASLPLQSDAASQDASLKRDTTQGLKHGNEGAQSVTITPNVTLDGSVPRQRPAISPAEPPSFQPAAVTQLEIDREAARKAMRDGLAGKIELSAQQTALIKLLLKDELEPETERNLYAGRSTDELGERALVLSVSVLGIRKVAEMIRDLSKAGTLDLGLEWEPKAEREELPPVAEAVDKVESIVEWTKPTSVTSSVKAGPTPELGGVESLD